MFAGRRPRSIIFSLRLFARRTCGISIADSTATTDTHGSTSDTYGRWNIASQRGSWQLRTTRVRHPTDGRHDDVDTKRDDT